MTDTSQLRANLHAKAVAYQRARDSKQAVDFKVEGAAFADLVGFFRAKALDNPAALVEIFAPAGDGWQDIASAPDYIAGEPVLVWVFGGRYDKPTIIPSEGPWWRHAASKNFDFVPTHWAPAHVPAPPGAAS